MRLRFLYNAGVVVLLNLTVKPLWIFAIDRQVQNTAGPEAYGAYYTLLNLSLLLSALLDAGMSNYNTRKVAMEASGHRFDIGHFLGLKSLLFLAYLVISSLLVLLSGQAWHWLLLLIMLNQGIHFLNVFLRSYLAGLQQFKTEGFFGVLDKLLMTALAWPLLWGVPYLSGDLITDFVWVQTLAYGITCLALLWRLRPHAQLAWHFSMRKSAYWLRQSYPFALLGILMAGYTKLDAVLLARWASDGHLAVGIYAAGYRLLDAASMVPILVSGILLPQFAAMLANRQLEPAFVRTAALLLGGLGSLVAAVCYFQADWIMNLLYHHHTPEQTRVFQWLMWSFLPLSLNYVFGTLLTAGGKMKLLNSLAAGALALNVGLNAWLIPLHGAEGAAWAALITQSFMAMAQLSAAWKAHAWLADSSFLIRLLLWVLTLLGLCLWWPLPPAWGSLLTQALAGTVLLLLLFGQPFYARISMILTGRFS